MNLNMLCVSYPLDILQVPMQSVGMQRSMSKRALRLDVAVNTALYLALQFDVVVNISMIHEL